MYAAFLVQTTQGVASPRIPAPMEDGEFHNTGIGNHMQPQWRWQRSEESYVMPAQNVRPKTTMATMLNVEGLMTMEERRKCIGENRRRSICKQVIWWTCVDKECYGCYFKTNAIVDMGTTEFKWDTIIAIGIWKQKNIWANSSILEQIEHIAIFLATRPKERRN